MFKKNDLIVFGQQGVCKIIDIGKQPSFNNTIEYYVLETIGNPNNQTKIYVPIENGDLTSKMLPILNLKEVNALIKAMPGNDSIWVEDRKLRSERFQTILAEGDRTKLLGMIKTLHEKQAALVASNKKLGAEDKKFLTFAEKRIEEEFAHVLKLDANAVVPYILEQLDENVD